MPRPPVPPELDALLARPCHAVIATVKPDGAPHTVATWYLWEGGRVLVTMDAERRRLAFMEREPRVSLTVIDPDDFYRHISLRGRVVSLGPDVGLADSDRSAQHYFGRPYPLRDRPRVSAWIEIDLWHAWGPNQTVE